MGLIGYPVRHSISPVFQQAAFDYHCLDATYQAWEVNPEILPEFVAGLRSAETMGVNVTVPHKEAVMPYLDEVDDWAKTAGAVNTIVSRDGKLAGYNTDGSGFLRALEEHARFSPQGRRVLIIGAGGSARGVALALARQGASDITIANRTLERARSLAELIERHGSWGRAEDGPTAEAIPITHSEEPPYLLPGRAVTLAAARSDLLVNCTTLGMKHGPDEGASPLLAEHIPPAALVYDLVYNPAETPLLREARLAGAARLGGLPMLVYQGAASFELWTGRKAPVEVMLKAAESALS